MNGRSDRSVATVAMTLFVVGVMVGVFQVFAAGGFRINASPSLPMGLYVVTEGPNANLVEFCPAEPFARLAIVRGWRGVGNCPDGAAPLLKPVVARAGDVVELSVRGIAVNGHVLPNTAPLPRDSQGRSLQVWPFGRYVVGQATVWVASSYNSHSFDSRYFGPVPTNAIRDRLRPLFTVE